MSKEERKKNFSKSLKTIVFASAVLLATKVPAYFTELGEDSTASTLSVTAGGGWGGRSGAPPGALEDRVDGSSHSSHSSHSSRGWR